MAIVKRGENIYLIRVYLGRDPVTKRRLERNETFYGTFEEAEKREQILKAKAREGDLVRSPRMTVTKLMELYLDATRHNRREASQYILETQTERYVNPYIGSLQIVKVKTSDLQRFFNFLLDPKKDKADEK